MEIVRWKGGASVVLNGLTETIWVRGQQGMARHFAARRSKFGGGSDVYEGLIDFNGEFFFVLTTVPTLQASSWPTSSSDQPRGHLSQCHRQR